MANLACVALETAQEIECTAPLVRKSAVRVELATSTERVIPLVFTTGPVAISKCLDNA